MGRKRIAVYGSLRVGEYNFQRFVDNYGESSIKPLAQDINIEGFDLFDLGPYPAISRGKNNLVIDVLSVSENVFYAIDSMELGAGYHRDTVKVPKYGEITIYAFPEKSFPDSRLVVSGNWSEYLKTK